MSPNASAGRETLRVIARRAMTERGLLPDFSPAALAQTEALGERVVETGPAIRDLRGPRVGVDRQRRLARPRPALGGGAPRRRGGEAARGRGRRGRDGRGGQRDRRPRPREHDVRLHRGRDLPDAAREAVDRPDVARRGRGTGSRSSSRWRSAPTGRSTASDVYRALVRNQAKLAYDSVAAWLDGTGPRRRRPSPRGPGSPTSSACRTRVAQAMKDLRHHRGALTLETTRGAGRVRRRRCWPTCGRTRRTAAKELIEDFMIAANGATAQFLERHGFPSLRRVLRSPERWDRIVELAAGLGERLPAEPSAPRARGVSRAPAPGRSGAVRRCVALRREAAGLGRVRGGAARRRGGRPFRPRGEGLHALHRAEPSLPGPRDAAPAQGRDRRAPVSVHRRSELTELARHCTLQEDNATKVERQVRKSAAALLLAPRIGAAIRRDRHRRVAEGHLGAHPPAPRWRGAWCAAIAGLDVGDSVRVELVAHRRRARLHRLRPRVADQESPGNPPLAAWDCLVRPGRRRFVDSARLSPSGARGAAYGLESWGRRRRAALRVILHGVWQRDRA